MRKLEALSFAIDDAYDSKKNVGDEASEKTWSAMIKSLEKLENDIIRFLDKELTAKEPYKQLRK